VLRMRLTKDSNLIYQPVNVIYNMLPNEAVLFIRESTGRNPPVALSLGRQR
jgi:hypothetical protein